jgi:hypothetical protein
MHAGTADVDTGPRANQLALELGKAADDHDHRAAEAQYCSTDPHALGSGWFDDVRDQQLGVAGAFPEEQSR